MANNIEHVNIPDVQRHEPRGASTASANTFLVADGAGNTLFREIEKADLDQLNPSLAREDILVASTNTEIAFPMPLETKVVNFGSPVDSVGGNIGINAGGNIMLKNPGTYFYAAYVNAHAVGAPATDKAVMAFRIIDEDDVLHSSVTQSTVFAGTTDDLIVGSEFIQTDKPLELRLEAILLSEDAGISDVGIKSSPVSASGWTPVPAANIVVEKFKVS